MDDTNIKELINGYAAARMALLPDIDSISGHPPYSKRYKKYMKKLIRAGKYFGGKVRVYKVLARVAMIALIIVSMIGAGEVSAKVFGFAPWEYLLSYISDSNMWRKEYKSKTVENQSEHISPVSDTPTYIPDGYELTDEDRTGDMVSVTWEKKDTSDPMDGIAYDRFPAGDGAVISEDAEYESKQDVNICGYIGKYYKKGEESWVSWDDDRYFYSIQVGVFHISKDTVLRIAESVYKKN